VGLRNVPSVQQVSGLRKQVHLAKNVLLDGLRHKCFGATLTVDCRVMTAFFVFQKKDAKFPPVFPICADLVQRIGTAQKVVVANAFDAQQARSVFQTVLAAETVQIFREVKSVAQVGNIWRSSPVIWLLWG